MPAVPPSPACQRQKDARTWRPPARLTQRSDPTNVLQIQQKLSASWTRLWVLHGFLRDHKSLQAVEVTQDKSWAHDRGLLRIQDLQQEPQKSVCSHLFPADSAQHPFRLAGFFFFCQFKHSQSLIVMTFPRDRSSRASSESVLCISEICSNPSTKIRSLTVFLPDPCQAQGGGRVSRGWDSQQPCTAPNSSQSSNFHL